MPIDGQKEATEELTGPDHGSGLLNVGSPSASITPDKSSDIPSFRAIDAPNAKTEDDYVKRQDPEHEESAANYYATQVMKCAVGPMPAKSFLYDFLPYNRKVKSSSPLENEKRGEDSSLVRPNSQNENDTIQKLVSFASVYDTYININTDGSSVY